MSNHTQKILKNLSNIGHLEPEEYLLKTKACGSGVTAAHKRFRYSLQQGMHYFRDGRMCKPGDSC